MMPPNQWTAFLNVKFSDNSSYPRNTLLRCQSSKVLGKKSQMIHLFGQQLELSKTTRGSKLLVKGSDVQFQTFHRQSSLREQNTPRLVRIKAKQHDSKIK